MRNKNDALHQEIYEIEKDMRSISPKLELYKKLEKRLAELKEKLEGIRKLSAVKK